MVNITRGSVAIVKAEGQELLHEHYLELTKHKEVVKLAPDWEAYEGLEAAGKLMSLVVRAEGVLVGYAAFLIGPHLHYRDLFVAVNDVLFLKAEYRGSTGVRLIKAVEDLMQKLGVQKILWHAKPGTVLEKLLPRMDYSPEDTVFGKLLGD